MSVRLRCIRGLEFIHSYQVASRAHARTNRRSSRFSFVAHSHLVGGSVGRCSCRSENMGATKGGVTTSTTLTADTIRVQREKVKIGEDEDTEEVVEME